MVGVLEFEGDRRGAAWRNPIAGGGERNLDFWPLGRGGRAPEEGSGPERVGVLSQKREGRCEEQGGRAESHGGMRGPDRSGFIRKSRDLREASGGQSGSLACDPSQKGSLQECLQLQMATVFSSVRVNFFGPSPVPL